jgi:4-amino-4-deoxy-L-arabinose transferase-like glycosyltransferase
MRGLVLTGAMALLALFLGLDRVDFTDDREARDVAVARAIVEDRNPLVPRLGGEIWLEKPVLAYAPEAAGLLLTPGSPVGSRVIRACGAVLLVLLVGLIGARHLGAGAARCSAAVLATSLALPLAARSDGVQLFATALGWLALGSLIEVLRGHRPGWRLPVAYVALAVALLIAGPAPALWPLGAVAVTLARARAWSRWRRLQPLAGMAIVLGAALPWYGAVGLREGAGFAIRALGFPYAIPASAPWFTAPARSLGFLFVGFFPWSTLLAAAVLKVTTRPVPARGEPGDDPLPAEHFFVAALGVALIPIWLAPGAALSAGLPALPAAALLVGALIERALAGEALWERAVAQAGWVFAITGTVAAVFIAGASQRLVEGGSEVRLLAAILLVVSWAPVLASFVRRNRALPALLALPVAVGTALVAWRTLPALSGYLTTEAVAQSMAATAPPGTPLATLDPPPASLRLRFSGPLVEVDDPAVELPRLRGSDGHVYVAFHEEHRSALARAVSPRPIEILIRTPALDLARIRID